ncbi:serine-rich adhesin for platelets-like [Sycon ciliatum]|uniref:serine-rich adhesin for platelets-like n=1 Tax=Sycon ciliatum TaxID=27933 RepID=UPI0031F656A1
MAKYLKTIRQKANGLKKRSKSHQAINEDEECTHALDYNVVLSKTVDDDVLVVRQGSGARHQSNATKFQVLSRRRSTSVPTLSKPDQSAPSTSVAEVIRTNTYREVGMEGAGVGGLRTRGNFASVETVCSYEGYLDSDDNDEVYLPADHHTTRSSTSDIRSGTQQPADAGESPNPPTPFRRKQRDGRRKRSTEKLNAWASGELRRRRTNASQSKSQTTLQSAQDSPTRRQRGTENVPVFTPRRDQVHAPSFTSASLQNVIDRVCSAEMEKDTRNRGDLETHHKSAEVSGHTALRATEPVHSLCPVSDTPAASYSSTAGLKDIIQRTGVRHEENFSSPERIYSAATGDTSITRDMRQVSVGLLGEVMTELHTGGKDSSVFSIQHRSQLDPSALDQLKSRRSRDDGKTQQDCATVVVLQDYAPYCNSAKELAARRGDVMRHIMADGRWSLLENGAGRRGFLPTCYCQFVDDQSMSDGNAHTRPASSESDESPEKLLEVTSGQSSSTHLPVSASASTESAVVSGLPRNWSFDRLSLPAVLSSSGAMPLRRSSALLDPAAACLGPMPPFQIGASQAVAAVATRPVLRRAHSDTNRVVTSSQHEQTGYQHHAALQNARQQKEHHLRHHPDVHRRGNGANSTSFITNPSSAKTNPNFFKTPARSTGEDARECLPISITHSAGSISCSNAHPSSFHLQPCSPTNHNGHVFDAARTYARGNVMSFATPHLISRSSSDGSRPVVEMSRHLQFSSSCANQCFPVASNGMVCNCPGSSDQPCCVVSTAECCSALARSLHDGTAAAHSQQSAQTRFRACERANDRPSSNNCENTAFHNGIPAAYSVPAQRGTTGGAISGPELERIGRDERAPILHAVRTQWRSDHDQECYSTSCSAPPPPRQPTGPSTLQDDQHVVHNDRAQAFFSDVVLLDEESSTTAVSTGLEVHRPSSESGYSSPASSSGSSSAGRSSSLERAMAAGLASASAAVSEEDLLAPSTRKQLKQPTSPLLDGGKENALTTPRVEIISSANATGLARTHHPGESESTTTATSAGRSHQTADSGTTTTTVVAASCTSGSETAAAGRDNEPSRSIGRMHTAPQECSSVTAQRHTPASTTYRRALQQPSAACIGTEAKPACSHSTSTGRNTNTSSAYQYATPPRSRNTNARNLSVASTQQALQTSDDHKVKVKRTRGRGQEGLSHRIAVRSPEIRTTPRSSTAAVKTPHRESVRHSFAEGGQETSPSTHPGDEQHQQQQQSSPFSRSVAVKSTVRQRLSTLVRNASHLRSSIRYKTPRANAAVTAEPGSGNSSSDKALSSPAEPVEGAEETLLGRANYLDLDVASISSTLSRSSLRSGRDGKDPQVNSPHAQQQREQQLTNRQSWDEWYSVGDAVKNSNLAVTEQKSIPPQLLASKSEGDLTMDALVRSLRPRNGTTSLDPILVPLQSFLDREENELNAAVEAADRTESASSSEANSPSSPVERRPMRAARLLVMFDYGAQRSDELSVCTGDVLYAFVGRCSNGRVQVHAPRTGSKGYVPIAVTLPYEVLLDGTMITSL